MRFFSDPNFVILDYSCPYCDHETTATVHEDGAACCNRCSACITPPMSYEDARAEYEASLH